MAGLGGLEAAASPWSELRSWSRSVILLETGCGPARQSKAEALLARYPRCNVVYYGGYQDTRSTETRSAVADGRFTLIRSRRFCI